MDYLADFGSGPRSAQDEGEDWFRYLDLDDLELHTILDNVSMPGLMTGLEVWAPQENKFGSETLQSIDHLPDSQPPRTIQASSDQEKGSSKRERQPSASEGSNRSNLDQPMKKKVRKTRFTATQSDIMETWLACHLQYPYPQPKEKEQLASATGLTVRQIQAWFARTRQRKLRSQIGESLQPVNIQDSNMLSPSFVSRASSQHERSPQRSREGSSTRLSMGPGRSSLIVIPASPQTYQMDDQHDQNEWETQSDNNPNQAHGSAPFELSHGASKVQWWLSTLPLNNSEYDPECILDHYWGLGSEIPTSLARIPSASTNEFDSRLASTKSATPANSFERSTSKLDEPMSISSPLTGNFLIVPDRRRRAQDTMSVSSSSLGTNRIHNSLPSVGSDYVSAGSTGTFGTSVSSISLGRRRGRRMPGRRRSISPMKQTKGLSQSLKYHCTFCSDRFRDKYRWKRHEESIHAPQKVWVCKPVRPIPEQPAICPLCYFSEGILKQCVHDMQPCWSRLEKERTFYRKDNLVQHLEGVHNARAGISSALLDELTEGISSVPYDLTCHFCGRQNTTWQERAEHIAKHFEEGMTMVSWRLPGPDANSPMTLAQVQPYLPRLSRLWASNEEKSITESQRRRSQSLSLYSALQPHGSHLPQIIVEDFSSPGDDQETQRQLERPADAAQVIQRPEPDRFFGKSNGHRSQMQHGAPGQSGGQTPCASRPDNAIMFKTALPKRSMRSKIGKLLKGFSLS